MVNSEPEFFEGVEKLLEVWFTCRDGKIGNSDLRKLTRDQLEELMRVVKCEIISRTSADEVDAYVLSESSMFVSQQRFILKTCGTTTPLACLTLLTDLVFQFTGFDMVQDLYYSRKNFKRPELQLTPHRTFKDEAESLDEMFPQGRAYVMGTMNKDCWYLYCVPRQGSLQPDHKHDQTLEVLMTDLDQEKMRPFFQANCSDARTATKLSGIDLIIPGAVVDDYLFQPCGYSMNGVLHSVPGGYMTIHITPEEQFSYVSFETNIPVPSYKALIQRIIDMFGPKRFIVTFFSNSAQLDVSPKRRVPAFPEFHVDDEQVCNLPDYDLTYALYTQSPS